MQFPTSIKLQNPQKTRKYYLMHQSNNRLTSSKNSNTSRNIFSQKQSNPQYFPTFPTQNPFTSRKQQFSQKKYNSFKSQQLSQKSINLTGKLRIPNQSVYKQNKPLTNQVISHSVSCNQKSINMPHINKNNRAISNRTQLIGNPKRNQQIIVNRHKKLDKIVNKFLYQQGIVSQAAFNADLRQRCGDQYFQQILRQRHKQQMKPKPYLYSLRNNSQILQTPFIKYVKQLHPEIKLRQKMKIKGINKIRIRTQISPQQLQKSQQKQKVRQKMHVNISRLKSQSTQSPLF